MLLYKQIVRSEYNIEDSIDQLYSLQHINAFPPNTAPCFSYKNTVSRD